ncbi:MAG: hypothetical protein WCE94_09355 [Candidatus Methanoperedens sp.]
MKITKKTVILILCTAVLLVSAPIVATVFAQPIGIERGYVRTFVEPLIVGHGFALDGTEYHILDVNAIKMSDVSSGNIRSLLSQNKTRAGIATDIRNYMQNAPTKAMGTLMFAGQEYALNITTYDNQSLTGNVLTLPQRGINQTGFTPTIVGSISLSMSKYEGVMLSTGTLTMNNTNYNVLLTSPVITSSGRSEMFEHQNPNETLMRNSTGMFGFHSSKR